MNKSILAIGIAAIFLQSCGSDSDDSIVQVPQSAPVFNLSVSDAPVENAVTVVACFSQIELKSSDNNNEKTFLIGDTLGAADANDMCTDSTGAVVANTRGIDLLSVAGMQHTDLLTGIEINPGNYSQIRLVMNPFSYVTVDMDEDGVADDIDQDGEPDKIPLRVPSNELKLDGFTATVGATSDLTVEFDLRKGMTNPVGQQGYILKPRGVRIVDNSTSGHIKGTVSEILLMNNECDVAPADINQSVANVYLYSGTALNQDQLADNGGAESIESVTSASVFFDGASTYNFEIGFVRSGDYTLALTCDEDTDPEGDDELGFIALKEATVGEKGEVTSVTFTE